MGNAEAGSAKAIGNAIKAKGLGRLRWYCQICEKQCRDENGFQAHCRSEPHMRKIMLVGPKAGNAISEFSRQFQYDFVLLLRTRHQTNRVRANAVYNEYIQDKHHVHMNSTRWVTLSGFVQTLGKAGIVRVDEDEKGIWIQWIDNRPETLSKQAALQKRDRAEMDGEERERRVLEDQIARAKAQMGDQDVQNVGLQKKEGEKITLNLFGGPSTAEEDKKPDLSTDGQEEDQVKIDGAAGPSSSATGQQAAKASFSFGSFSTSSSTAKPVATVNPLKRPAPVNVFKAAKAVKTDREGSTAGGSGSEAGKKFMSEAERLMKEDQARKSRGPGQSQGYRGMGPSRGGR
ncbi:hypothetical protein IAR55_005142 [Kwoniella newhampshirensis]|uniref:DNA/RNA-binding protein Kin17 WH-like domain-containing protein n=1 Tax=Kwoniella newhampshirensis TaxID=1651941 RepID=A0AAW0YWV9_9TREE